MIVILSAGPDLILVEVYCFYPVGTTKQVLSSTIGGICMPVVPPE
jgi:hypothetical protein